MRAPVLLPAVLLALCSLAGCGGGTLVDAPPGRPGAPPPIDASRLSADLRRFSAVPTDSSSRARRAALVASALRGAGWMPALDGAFDRGSFRVPAGGGETEHVWAYLAGREPGRYSELVIVAADMDAAVPLAATLETARRFSRQAAFDQVPERSILLALLAPPRTGAVGLGDLARRPPWALDAVRHVLYVTADSARAQTVPADAPPLGAPVEPVLATTLAEVGTSRFFTPARALASATALADSLYDALYAAAVPAPDTTQAAP